MTLAFDTFMKQHNMTGSEKADGYSKDSFVGLESHEKETVFQLLSKELPWSVEWLFYLDPAKALVVAKKEEEKLRGDPFQHVYMLQQHIAQNTGDLLYQKRMIEDYPHYTDNLKPLVVDAISRTPVNKAVIDFFKQVILVEANPSAVARASRHVLKAVKVPRTNEIEERKFSRMVSELRSEEMHTKLRAIAEVERYQQLLSIPEGS